MWNPLLKKRGLDEVERRLHSSQTFTQPLRPTPSTKEKMKVFITKFYKEVYTPEKKAYYKQTLDENAETLRLHYDILVPKIVAYEDFWQRYEYRCNLQNVMEELAEADGGVLSQLSGSVSSLTSSFNTSIRNLSIVAGNSSGGQGIPLSPSSSQPATPAASGHGVDRKRDGEQNNAGKVDLGKIDVIKPKSDDNDDNSDATAGTDDEDDDIEGEDEEDKVGADVEDAKNIAAEATSQQKVVETSASEEQQ